MESLCLPKSTTSVEDIAVIINVNIAHMKNKITNKCGGKSSGCCADIILPHGTATVPVRVSDK
jgi:hypothetical protein